MAKGVGECGRNGKKASRELEEAVAKGGLYTSYVQHGDHSSAENKVLVMKGSGEWRTYHTKLARYARCRASRP